MKILIEPVRKVTRVRADTELSKLCETINRYFIWFKMHPYERNNL